MQNTSMESFLLHPLFIRVVNNYTCLCSTSIPEIEQYRIFKQYIPSIAPVLSPNLASNFEQSLTTWLTRRNLTPCCSKIGIIDPPNKFIHAIDMVVQDTAGDITFITWFPSHQRFALQRQTTLITYARLLRQKTRESFQFTPKIALLNVYGDSCKISSHWVTSGDDDESDSGESSESSESGESSDSSFSSISSESSK
jgi:hypothetical protein